VRQCQSKLSELAERVEDSGPKKKELTTVEASADAIASAGFGMSRSKMADLIDGGDVRVNWKETTKLVLRLKQAT